MSNKEITIFDALNAIFYKRPSYEYDKKTAPPYLLSMWLSHDKEILPIVEKINQYLSRIPECMVYRYFYSKVPKKSRFIKWTKKKPTSDVDTSLLMERFSLSKKEAMLYKDLV